MHKRFVPVLAVLALVVGALLVPSTALATACTTPKLVNSNTLADSTHQYLEVTSISGTDSATGCTYADLTISALGRSAYTACGAGGYSQSAWLQLSSGGSYDTGSDYNYDLIYFYGTGVGELGGKATTNIGIRAVTCSDTGAPANSATGWYITIPNAFSTSFDKEVIFGVNVGYNTSCCLGVGTQGSFGGALWHLATPAAIDAVRLFATNGNWLSGSEISVWER